MNRVLNLTLAVAVATLTSACATMIAPEYSASLENVQTLKNLAIPAKVGEFTFDPAASNELSLRGGNKMYSPYEKSYANYIREALKQELDLAKLLSPAANVEISGVLLTNNIDIGGFSTGTASVSVRFVVKKGGQVNYDAVKSATQEFPSSFAGAIAIPKAQQEYTISVQKVLAALYADPAFVAAIK